jgi:hypothetical protein
MGRGDMRIDWEAIDRTAPECGFCHEEYLDIVEGCMLRGMDDLLSLKENEVASLQTGNPESYCIAKEELEELRGDYDEAYNEVCIRRFYRKWKDNPPE